MAHSCTFVGDDETADRVERVVAIAVIEVFVVGELHVRMAFRSLWTFVCKMAFLPAHKTSDFGHVAVVVVGLVGNELRVLLIRCKLDRLLLKRYILVRILVGVVVVSVSVPIAVPAIVPASVDAVPICHNCFCSFDNSFWELVVTECELISQIFNQLSRFLLVH